MSMRTGEWWDDAAPYGANGYTFERGEVVNMTGVRVAREFTFETTDRQASARGTAELTDGRVYQFTILRPSFAREAGGRERVRLATLSRQDFRSLASGLLEFEIAGDRVASSKVDEYRAAAAAL